MKELSKVCISDPAPALEEIEQGVMTVELANHIKERKIIERRNYIYKLLHYDFFVKDTYIQMPGTIILHYNNKEYKFKTKDLGRRLDEIIRDL